MQTKNPNKSLLRALSVIKSFNPNELELGSTDIAKKTGIPIPTAYRILSTFAEAGLLEKNENTNKYRIGPVFYMIGNLYLSTTDILRAAEPVVRVMNELTGEQASLSTLDHKGNITFMMREDTKHRLRIDTSVGFTSPAYAHAPGKALLSELTDVEIDSLYLQEKLEPLTRKTVSTKTELKKELELVRKTGFVLNSEQAIEGAEAVAAVIRDDTGKAVAAMTIGAPLVRINKTRREILIKLVKMGTSLISYKLGYKDAVNPIHDIQEIRDWCEESQGANYSTVDKYPAAVT